LLEGTPVGLLTGLGAGVGLLVAGVEAGWLPAAALRVGAVAAGHGGLLAVALGWAGADGPPGRGGPRAAVVCVALLALGEGAARLSPRLAPALLAVPLWLAALAAAGRLRTLGLRRPVRPGAVLAGAGVGAALGGHLVLSASRTLGHHLRDDGIAPYVAALAYDAGANVPSAELFFRGALFNRLQRRWALAPAAAVATGACVVRYLVDPLLPAAPEILVGAVVYLSILGAANAWLLWWSGSLLPGLVAATLFFAVYRLLALS
jgi:hypothetical protein